MNDFAKTLESPTAESRSLAPERPEMPSIPPGDETSKGPVSWFGFLWALTWRQGCVDVTAVCLLCLMGPRLLLLREDTAGRFFLPAIESTLAFLFFSLITTFVVTRKLRSTIEGIAAGSSVSARAVLEIDSLPARLSIAKVVTSFVFSSSLALPWIATIPYDVDVVASLAALLIAFMSAGAITLYIFLRKVIATVIERTPPDSSLAAIAIVEQLPQDRVPRIRTRFLLAVVGPVAFVGMGTVLLVSAHVRSLELRNRLDIGRIAVEATGSEVEASTNGRELAFDALKGAGLVVARGSSIIDGRAFATAARVSGTDYVVTVPPPHFSPQTGFYALVAALICLGAGILGSLTGGSFTRDLGLATRSMRTIGVEDVIKGTKMVQGARFQTVVTLLDSVDVLGDLFRRFASAHERAIGARQASERMRGFFLASMSHDLKAPLNAILGFADLVGRQPLTEGQRESVTIIAQRGRELLHLIHTILDSARLEEGPLDLHVENVSSSDVVMAAVLDARDLVAGSEIEVTANLQPGLPFIVVDSQRMVQALTNVILTASRLVHEARVHVSASLPPSATFDVGERIRIDIETAGAHVAEDELGKLFDAFHHADRARRHGSLGLGLALARKLVDEQGGSITVESTRASGVVFQIWLPIDPVAYSVRRPSIRPKVT